MRSRKILIVVAHPDDESFFMGGMLAKLSQTNRVTVVALADGVGARGPVGWRPIVTRRKQFVRACEILGATPDYRPLFADQRSDASDQIDINRGVETIIRKHTPKVVFTHHVGDLNLDHRRVAEAVLVATRPGSSTVEQVYCMAPEWPSRCVGPAWAPTVHCNIRETLPVKVRACLTYKAEVRPYPHPRSARSIRGKHIESFMAISE